MKKTILVILICFVLAFLLMAARPSDNGPTLNGLKSGGIHSSAQLTATPTVHYFIGDPPKANTPAPLNLGESPIEYTTGTPAPIFTMLPGEPPAPTYNPHWTVVPPVGYP